VFGILLSLEPAVAALAGWALLAQPVGTREAVGVGVVVLASLGSTLSARQSVNEPPGSPALAAPHQSRAGEPAPQPS
jgi:inner membrane transporter RhtA